MGKVASIKDPCYTAFHDKRRSQPKSERKYLERHTTLHQKGPRKWCFAAGTRRALPFADTFSVQGQDEDSRFDQA